MFKRISVKTDPELSRVDCYNSLMVGQPNFTFWVPTTSLDEYGNVPGSIIRARIKHALGFNQGPFMYVKEPK